MRPIGRTAAPACAALALVSALTACELTDVERHSVDATRYFSEKVLGTEYDVRLTPTATADTGPLVVTRTRLIFEDGMQIPLSQVRSGIYRTPSLRTRYGARGSRLCGGQPVSYLALHQGPDDLYYLNAGDWATAPAVPGHDVERIPGACETAAYTLGAKGS